MRAAVLDRIDVVEREAVRGLTAVGAQPAGALSDLLPLDCGDAATSSAEPMDAMARTRGETNLGPKGPVDLLEFTNTLYVS